MHRIKNELKIVQWKGNSLRKNVCDQQILIGRNGGTYEIPTDKQGEARGKKNCYYWFLIEDPNMMRHDWFKQN